MVVARRTSLLHQLYALQDTILVSKHPRRLIRRRNLGYLAHKENLAGEPFSELEKNLEKESLFLESHFPYDNLGNNIASESSVKRTMAANCAASLLNCLEARLSQQKQILSEKQVFRRHTEKLLNSFDDMFSPNKRYIIPDSLEMTSSVQVFKKLATKQADEAFIQKNNWNCFDYLDTSLKITMKNNETQLTNAISTEQRNMSGNSIIKPYLKLLSPKLLANLTILRFLYYFRTQPKNVLSIDISRSLGFSVFETVCNLKSVHELESSLNYTDYVSAKVSNLSSIQNTAALNTLLANTWSDEVQVKLGFTLVQLAQKVLKVPIRRLKVEKDGQSSEQKLTIPLFEFGMMLKPPKQYKTIIPNQAVLREIGQETKMFSLISEPRLNAMVCRPKVWTKPEDGGFFLQRHSLIRRMQNHQVHAVKNMETNEYIYQAINQLSAVPWTLNKRIYYLAARIHKDQLDLGGMVGVATKEDSVEKPEKKNYANNANGRTAFKKDMTEYFHREERINKDYTSQVSKQMDVTLKLEKAKELLDQEKFWFPYNCDFRGRVYPIPAHLNHIQSDLSRSLLHFSDKKPLTDSGLRWLKIQIANLFGFDKASFEDRVKWTEDKIRSGVLQDSAEYPIDETDPTRRKWWNKASEPWQFLASIMELNEALKLPNPEEFCTGLPIYQDGSCNGLQHYAAMGRDLQGGKQVNLVDSDFPQDVYADVCQRVQLRTNDLCEAYLTNTSKDQRPRLQLLDGKRINEPSFENYKDISTDNKQLTDKEARKNYFAWLLRGKINRKVVKQTVMTSVYGVTLIGAADQIRNQLNYMNAEIIDKHGKSGPSEDVVATNAAGACNPEDTTLLTDTEINLIGLQLAQTTLDAIGESFAGATSLMKYLKETASLLAKYNESMKWISPIGLPIEQNYYKKEFKTASVRGKSISYAVNKSTGKLDKLSERTAFPPNFVHSLDASHMLLTALRCFEQEITFTAVHDSYWCLPCDVDKMNKILREEFVALHKTDVVATFHQQLLASYPFLESELINVPDKGELDLEEVLKSRYFFH